MRQQNRRPETAAVRGASELEKKNAPVTAPIYQTSTFEVTDNEEQIRVTTTDRYYTRWGNPTITLAEQTIAAIEGTETARVFASGMGAITTTILALLKAGDHIVTQRDIYGGVTKFFSQWLPKVGIETTFVPTNDFEQFAQAIRPNTKLLHLESPTNPTLRIVDFKKAASLAKQHGLITLLDSTFGTPINQHPAEYGIDLVMHSGTKYLSGHADLTCGVVCGRAELMEPIDETRKSLGNCMDPHAAWLLIRGLKTLAVRVARHNENALRAAKFLEQHAKVRRVYYPFLNSNPECVIARAQMSGGSGMVTFEVDGSGEDARRVSEAMRLFTLATSLGGVESLVSIPVLTSHAMISEEQRKEMGVNEQMVRLSVGIESADDLIADLDKALEVVRRRAPVSVGSGRR
jgi:cystathionine beta-lyase/cystathionine gamma-synthase